MPGDLLSDELVKIGCFPQSTLNRSPAKPTILYHRPLYNSYLSLSFPDPAPWFCWTAAAAALSQRAQCDRLCVMVCGAAGAGGGQQLLTSGASASKKNTSRRNAWGNLSYADLITQAISSSAETRLTLSQIYEWMVQNVPYFKDKGDSNSSAGWKVSRPDSRHARPHVDR